MTEIYSGRCLVQRRARGLAWRLVLRGLPESVPLSQCSEVTVTGDSREAEKRMSEGRQIIIHSLPPSVRFRRSVVVVVLSCRSRVLHFVAVANKWIWTYGNTFRRPCGPEPHSTQLDVERLLQARVANATTAL